jgi:hypothetical protein
VTPSNNVSGMSTNRRQNSSASGVKNSDYKHCRVTHLPI